MPTHAGPNPALDSNIVFSYDVGDTINSYKGEPTVNYQWNGGSEVTPWTVGGINTDVTNTINQGPIIGAKTWKFQKTGTSNQWNGWESSYGGIWTGNAGDIWTTSYWYKTTNDAGMGGFWVGAFYKSDWSAPYNTTVLSSVSSIIPDGQWHYNYTTTQFNENYSNAIIVDGPSWGYSGQAGELYINGLQWEKKPHATPFAYGTRSVTQSLFPLISNSTINLSNVSFDSNAQIVFDGTDDYIDIANNSSLQIVDNITIEIIAKINPSNIGDIKVIANKYSGTGWELLLDTSGKFLLAGRNGDGTYYTSNSQTIVANNNYYHLVAIKSGLLWQTYVNGNLTSTTTATSIGTLSNSVDMQIGREGSGYYPSMYLPVFKVYNTVLSTGQVKQNYQQYKTRFNLS
jgi:hypothetical protein